MTNPLHAIPDDFQDRYKQWTEHVRNGADEPIFTKFEQPIVDMLFQMDCAMDDTLNEAWVAYQAKEEEAKRKISIPVADIARVAVPLLGFAGAVAVLIVAPPVGLGGLAVLSLTATRLFGRT